MNNSTSRPIILFLLLLVVQWACKRRTLPDSLTGDPVFNFTGTINGQQMSLQAGVADLYLFTDFTQETTGEYILSGRLATSGCALCPGELQLAFVDDVARATGAPFPKDSVALPGNYDFAMNTIAGNPTYHFRPDTSIPTLLSTFLWDFGDGTQSNQYDPIKQYNAPGMYNICLTVIDSTGCTQTLCHNLSVDPSSSTCDPRFIVTEQQGIYNFSVLNPSPALNYVWDMGDNTILTGTNVPHQYPFPNLYTIALQVTGLGCNTTFRYQVLVDSFYDCRANFTYDPPILPGTPKGQTILITYRDDAGRLFTSRTTYGQPASSYFRILSAEDYTINEKGDATRLFRFEINAFLYEGNDSIPIIGAGTWALAYPE